MSDLFAAFGEQFLSPVDSAVDDALEVAVENATRLWHASQALKGNYPRGLSPFPTTNGHELPVGPVAALNPAPTAPVHRTAHAIDADRVDARTVTLKDLTVAVLLAGAKHNFMGMAEEPGAMKASEVMEVMTRWGWHPSGARPVATVSATLAALWKQGLAIRLGEPGSGNYIHAGAVGSRVVLYDDAGGQIDPNMVPIKELCRLILVRARGQTLRPNQIVDIAVTAGWRNSTTHRVSTVRSMCTRLVADGTARRPSPGAYAIPHRSAVSSPSVEPLSEPLEPGSPDPRLVAQSAQSEA